MNDAFPFSFEIIHSMDEARKIDFMLMWVGEMGDQRAVVLDRDQKIVAMYG
jgi:hypothetical protein